MGYLSAHNDLAMDYLWAGYRLVISYPSAGYGLSIGWIWAAYQLSMGWLCATYQLAIGWLWAIYMLFIGCLLTGERLAISYLLAGHGLGYGLSGLAMGRLWAIWAGYGLARSYLSAGYRPKSIHLKTYYCVPKLHMAVSNTLDCSVFIRFMAISWQLAGYGPNSKHFIW